MVSKKTTSTTTTTTTAMIGTRKSRQNRLTLIWLALMILIALMTLIQFFVAMPQASTYFHIALDIQNKNFRPGTTTKNRNAHGDLVPQRTSSSTIRPANQILTKEERERLLFHLQTTPILNYPSNVSLWNGTRDDENNNRYNNIDRIELRPHPHAGAVDEHGNYHYHFDPTTFFSEFGKYPPPTLRMRVVTTNITTTNLGGNNNSVPHLYDVCASPPGMGGEGNLGYDALVKIRQNSPTLTQAAAATSVSNRNPPSSTFHATPEMTTPKILCVIYTHSNRHHQVRSVLQTWGQRCNGFIAASNLTDPSIAAVNILHDGPESYDNMWQKVRSIWAYVHDHYLDKFDYFHLGGDDMYVIVEHLRDYVRSLESALLITANKHDTIPPLYLGESVSYPSRPHQRFCGGGAGYTLNREALLLLVRRGFVIRPDVQKMRVPTEDMNVALLFYALRSSLNTSIQCFDTHDSAKAVRYHHLDAQIAADPTQRKLSSGKLKVHHGFSYSERGLASVSNTTISFHLTDKKNRQYSRAFIDNPFQDHFMRRYHAILYRQCAEQL